MTTLEQASPVFDRPGTPMPTSSDWRAPLFALALAGLVVAAGVAATVASFKLATLWYADAPALTLSVVSLLATAAGHLTALALTWIMVGALYGTGRLAELSMHLPRIGLRGWIGVVVAMFTLKILVMIPLMALSKDGAAKATSDALAPLAGLMATSAWPVLVGVGVLAAVTEEIIYRGYLSRALEGSRLGFWGGAAVAALFWAAAHYYYPLPAQVSLVALGIALSYVRRRTGSIYPGMLWHVLNNTLAFAVMRVIA